MSIDRVVMARLEEQVIGEFGFKGDQRLLFLAVLYSALAGDSELAAFIARKARAKIDKRQLDLALQRFDELRHDEEEQREHFSVC